MDKQDYSLKKKTAEQSLTIIFLCIIVGMVILFNIVSTRIDLTKNNVYSLSKTTQNFIREIDAPVYVTYYVSDTLKLQDKRPQEMIDILEEYPTRSKGNVVFLQKNPSDPEARKEIETHRLEGGQMQVLEGDKASFARVYSGIVISYKTKTTVLPYVIDPSNIEYQVTSKIMEIYNDDETVIGILPVGSLINAQDDIKLLEQVLGENADVIVQNPQQEIDDDVDVLVVIGGSTLDNDTAYKIDQFVMSGRGVFFAVDRVSADINQGLDIVLQENNILADMLEAYGVSVEPYIVADIAHGYIPIVNGNVQQLSPYALWIKATDGNFNREHILTSNFSGLDSFWTSPIDGTNLEGFVPLVQTTKDAWTISATPAAPRSAPQDTGNGGDEENIIMKFQAIPDPTNFSAFKTTENTKQYTVAGAFHGALESAVEKGIITNTEGDADYVAKSNAARFVIVGNTSFFNNQLYRITNATYNLAFISNAAEWLSKNEDLLKIKIRGARNTQLNKIQGNKYESLKAFVKILNIVLIPLGIIIFAIVLLLFRRKISKI